MLSGSTVNSFCGIPVLGKYVVVSFLNASSITLPAQAKTRVCDIEALVVSYLSGHGLKSSELFGLALRIDDDEFLFVDGEKKLSKYSSRQWKASSNGLDQHGNPLLKFEYRVKYYLNCNVNIRDNFSKHYYYLQLRKNLICYDQNLLKEVLLRLVSFALQADIGDYDKERHVRKYFDLSSYFPIWFLEQNGEDYSLDQVCKLHSKLKGIPSSQCHSDFIRLASDAESAHNFHFYKLKKKKHDLVANVAISISDSGIGIYESDESINFPSSKNLVQSFLWSNIEDLSFDRKKFEIRAVSLPGKLTFFTSSDEKSKHILHLCRLTHTHHFSGNQIRRTDLTSGHSFNLSRPPHCGYILQERPSDLTDDSLFSHGPFSDAEGKVQSNFVSSADTIDSSVVDSEKNISFGEMSDNDAEYESGLDLVTSNSSGFNISWDDQSRQEFHCRFERTSSFGSSSSQHSASTLRSHYSLGPSRHCHELTLGAQLADLTLAPDLPDLADLPAMAADLTSRHGDSPDGSNQIHGSINNCCSTCYNDNASLASDDIDGEGDIKIGGDNECKFHEDTIDAHENLITSNSVFDIENHSAISCIDSGLVSSHYEQSSSEYDAFEDKDYVEFYKEDLIFPKDSAEIEISNRHLRQDLSPNDYSEPSSLERKISRNVGNSMLKSLNNKRTPPLEEEQTLDYSVESAQELLSAQFQLDNYYNYYSACSLGEDKADQNKPIHPKAVTMSKVTTVAPYNIVSSKINGIWPYSNSSTNIINHLRKNSHYEIINKTKVSTSSEAPAKFITSKPRITILKAQTQLASTMSPSFSSVPLTKSNVCTLPQTQQKFSHKSFQSLHRIDWPDQLPIHSIVPEKKNNYPRKKELLRVNTINQIPVIAANNYIDVHASSNLSSARQRNHPEHPSKMPRSLFLKNQKRKLQKQSMQCKYQIEKLHNQFLTNSVHHPAAYAQGVGVPLLPCPQVAECQSTSSQRQHRQYHNMSTSYFPRHNDESIMSYSQYSPQYQETQVDLRELNNIEQTFPILSSNCCNRNSSFNSIANCTPKVCKTPLSETNSDTYLISCKCSSDQGMFCCRNIDKHLRTCSKKLATVYANQVTKSQIEQYNAQLYSDTDYVIYPHKDPAISKQEYMDAKRSQVIAAQAQKNWCPNNHYLSSSVTYEQIPLPCKNEKSSIIYKSSPDVTGIQAVSSCLSSYPSYLSLASQNSTHQPGSSSGYSSMARGRYFSQQSLASSFSSVPSTHSASTQSLTGGFDPQTDTPVYSPSAVIRARSDESILSSSCFSEYDCQTDAQGHLTISNRPSPYRPKSYDQGEHYSRGDSFENSVTSSEGRPLVTLQQVREKGSQLDVPLLAALCSDSSLFQQECLSDNSSKSAKHSISSMLPETVHSANNSGTKSSGEEFFSSPTMNCSSMSSCSKINLHSKYALSGVYTTNQVPAPHLASKSSSKDNKPSRNVLHQHPKFLEIIQTKQIGSTSKVKSGKKELPL